MKKIFILTGILFFMGSLTSFAQDEWIVPDDAKNLSNPLKIDAAKIENGKNIYQKHCKSCHGDPGKDNGLPLQPKPIDPASKVFQKQTDGEIYYRITEGRGLMPQFKSILSEDDRWSVVAYQRTLDPNYSAADMPAEKVVEVSLPDGLNDIKIALELKPESHEIIAKVTGMDDGNEIVVPGAEVKFFAKRYFGNLPFGRQNNKTNAEGIASAEFPTDLPGDTTGNVEVIVALADSDRFGDVQLTKQLDWGKPTIPVNLLEKRSLWTVSRMAPIWLIASFLGVVLTVWGFIFYIIFQIIQLPKFGIKEE